MMKVRELAREVKLLCLVLASLLWLAVMLERNGEVRLQVPVVAGELPPGVARVTPSPATVEVVVSGPRILLCRLPFSELSCRLDLSGAGGGSASFAPKESAFGLHPELKLVRVLPATVSYRTSHE